jgi:hypothetical protein
VEPERCTCGAVLPEEARFCHKCGKPQYEEDIARLAALETPAPVQAPLAPPLSPAPPVGISFRNSRAVLISIVVAAAAFVGSGAAVLVSPLLFPVILCAAGFASARIYRRQSAEPMTTAAGARLGWMTGLWLFLIIAVLSAITAVYVSSPEGWQQVRAVWSQMPEVSKLLVSQHDFLVRLLTNLPFFFFLLTLLPGLGGMLGARSAPRRRPSP